MQPPPLEKPDRFAPWARHLLFGLVVVGSLAMLAIFMAVPAFQRMFMDFGGELPVATRILIQIRYLFLFAAIVPGVFAYLVLYKKSGVSLAPDWIFAALGLEFILFILAVSALFMPILQLAATSPGT